MKATTLVKTFLCVCVLGLLLPATAGAAVRWSVRGAGWGHGIGMSQYGAFGYAKQGFSHSEILQHYYTGTRIERRGTSLVRVLLQGNRSRVTFTGATSAGERGLEPNSVYSAVRSGPNVVLRSPSGRKLETYAEVLPISGGETVRLLGHAGNGVTSGIYRGAIEIRTAAGAGLNAINTLGIEDYVQGVVPAESPPIWPAEALAAQAVAARTYALTTGVNGKGFDQYPDTRSQVYRGLGAETATTNTAVSQTRGEVVTYGGRAVVTFFFSTSGGHTENVENVFAGSGPKPWLKGVSDPFDGASPYHRWGPLVFSTRQLTAKLGSAVKGRFRKLKVLRRGVSPRVVRAKVYGSRGNVTVNGSLLRGRLGLRDTWFHLRKVSSKTNRAKARTSSGTRPLAAIYGRVDEAAGRFVKLQKQIDGDWKTVELVPLLKSGKSGSYRIHVGERGSYRVRAGWAVGPTLTVNP